MMRRVFTPGEDRSRELAQTEQSLERLRWESDNGLIDDERLYRSRLSSLSGRRKALVAETVIPPRWDLVGTGKTYRELWADPETDRRQVLRDAGVRLVMHSLRREENARGGHVVVGIELPKWKGPSHRSDSLRLKFGPTNSEVRVDESPQKGH